MPSVGSYILIKNEAQFIAGHLLSWLPILDQMVFLDGNSTDGTLEIIKAIRKENSFGDKIKLIENKDPKDLRDDYVRLFDEALHAVDCEMAFFLHPDMIADVRPDNFNRLDDALAASVKMRSFAGEPGGELFELKGRGEDWTSIKRLRNPDLGLHYHGWYGSHHEDTYFSKITGNEHINPYPQAQPYDVVESGLEVLHFSDVRPYARRLGRMRTCLDNQGWGKKLTAQQIEDKAVNHPRVTLKSDDTYKFIPARYPGEFLAAQAQYAHLTRAKETAIV